MSGDVQPRKRKDKKRKKEDLVIEESTRGTAAVFGEGDVFIHSQHDHGTGGHWCAKIIFFSLLAVLITLIGLIILENRGLTDLEASTVQSQYSGVLEGWLEDAPDDDHHDEHTLELNHPEEVDEHDDDDEHEELEVEHIEREPVDEEPISTELPALPEEDDDDEQKSTENEDNDNDDAELDDKADDDFLENDDDDEEIVEHVTAPSGKPFAEVEDSTEELPTDTLAEEDEYEKHQEELRREEAEASHVWLKLGVGAALLLATHAVVRRATRHDNSENTEDDTATTEDSPSVIERRMTLIPKEKSPIIATKSMPSEVPKKDILDEKFIKKVPPILIQTTRPTQDDEEEIEQEPEDTINIKNIRSEPVSQKHETIDKELYSDEEELEEEETKEVEIKPSKSPPVEEHDDAESEDMPDDVEIIDDDQIEEELEEEDDDEEEISDVDDAELLSRLEAKYGRLPEPERPGQKHKDGGNSVDEFWADEPTDPYWREELDRAEQQLHQEYLN